MLEIECFPNKLENHQIKIIDCNEHTMLKAEYFYPIDQLLQLKSASFNIDDNKTNYYAILLIKYKLLEIQYGVDSPILYDLNNKLYTFTENYYNNFLSKHTLFNANPGKRYYENLYKTYLMKNSGIDVFYSVNTYLQMIKQYLGLNTINNQSHIICLINVLGLDNAFWNGSYMVFGSGNESFYPLTTIDIIGHELTHGLIQGICDLEYKGHSGALNESYADIFGICLKNYNSKKNINYRIGENIFVDNYFQCMRDMSIARKMYDSLYINPSSLVDHGGVHSNSGIPNHLFYLMTKRESIYNILCVFIRILFKISINCDFYQFSKFIAIENYIYKEYLNEIGLGSYQYLINDGDTSDTI